MYKLLQKLVPADLFRLMKDDVIFVPLLQRIFRFTFSFPKVVQLHINSECNLNCKYCYSKKETKYKINWRNIILQARDIGTKNIEFLGGEPFLDKNLRKYIRLCDKSNMNVKIYTNGTLIDPEWIDFFNSLNHLPLLVFKFDEAQSYDKYTDEKSLNIVSRNMKLCVDNKIPVHGHMIINSKNYNKVEEIIKVANSIGIVLTTERYMSVGNNIDDELYIGADKWNEALKVINNYYASLNKNYIVNSVIKGNTCSCYVDLLSIDVDGLVRPCPFADNAQIFGDIKKDTLKSLWKRFIRLRSEWLKIPDDCKGCAYRYLCHGGCKTMTYKQRRTYNAKDPLCNGEFIPTSIYSDQYLK